MKSSGISNIIVVDPIYDQVSIVYSWHVNRKILELI